MALQKMNPGVNDDEDDVDLEALRNAALQTLRKTCPPPTLNTAPVAQPPLAPMQPVHQGRSGPMRGRGKRGNRHGGAFRGNSHGFFNNRPPKISNVNSNPNLITIVPQAMPGEEEQDCTHKLESNSVPRLIRPQDKYMNRNAGQKVEPKTNGVFTKFSRLREDSDSEESSGDEDNKNEEGSDNEVENNDAGAISESVGDDDKNVDDSVPSDSEKDTDVMTLKAGDDDEDSLEKLIQKLDEEINKPSGVVPITPETPKPKVEAITPKLEAITPKPKNNKLNIKKEVVKVEREDSAESAVTDFQPIKEEPVTPSNNRLPVKLERLSPVSGDKAVSLKLGKVSPVSQESRCVSPRRYSRSPARLRSPRSRSPPRSKSPLRDRSISPQLHLSRVRSPLKTRSPLRIRSPPRTRSPLRARSRTRSRSRSRSPRRRSPLNTRPLRRSPSPWLARSPSRSPRRSPGATRSPYRVRSPYRPRSRTPRRSRSPRLRSPPRERSPSRSRTPVRSRSPVRARSPVRSRSPVRLRSPRRSRSPGRPRSPRRSRSPVRHISPLRRRSPYKRTPPRLIGGAVRSPVKWRDSRSRSPPPRPYARSRSRSPPRRRSRSPSPGRHYVAPRIRPRSPVREVRSRSPVVRLRSKSPPRQYSPVPRRKSPSPQRRRRSPSPRRSPRRYVAKSPTSSATWSPNAARLARSPVRRQTSPLPTISVAESKRSPRPEQRISPVRINRSPKPKSRTRKSVSPHNTGSPVAQARLSPRTVDDTGSLSPSHSPSLSLSPSPDRKEISPLRVVPRRPEGYDERKYPRAEQKERKSRPTDSDPTEPKPKKRSKKDKKKDKKKSKKSNESVFEVRRRKFESKGLVDVSAKKIRLKASPPKENDREAKKENSAMAKNVNPFEEYVDESILDAEFEDLYSSDEEVDEEQKAESVASSKEESEETQTVFTCTLNPPSEYGSEKENSAHEEDSPMDERKRSESRERSAAEDEEDEDSPAGMGPTTNWELKEMVMKQAKGSSDVTKASKRRVTGGSNAELDLRAELSRRRAERMNKVGAFRDMMPTRLVQTAFKEVGVKTRVNGRISPDDRENRGGDGRRVMLIKRQPERLVSGEAPLHIAPPKAEAHIESSSVKLKIPIHMRLGRGNTVLEERGRDRDRERGRRDHLPKVKTKRSVTLTRH